MSLYRQEERIKHKIREQLAEGASYLETGVSLLVLVGLLVSVVPLLREIPALWHSDSTSVFHVFLEHAFNLVIGIEFIKMLAKHSPGSALEVLLYAIARHMVLDASSATDNLLGVAAIGLIFVIRKFCFVSSFGATLPDGAPAPDVLPKLHRKTEDKDVEHS